MHRNNLSNSKGYESFKLPKIFLKNHINFDQYCKQKIIKCSNTSINTTDQTPPLVKDSEGRY